MKTKTETAVNLTMHDILDPYTRPLLYVGKRLKFCLSSTMFDFLAITQTCVVVAKRTSMLGKQNSKCLSSNACTFSLGFIPDV